MRSRLFTAALAAAASLCFAAPASAGIFRVTGLGDSPTATCAPSGTPGEFNCQSLRVAIGVASGSPDAEDTVLLGSGLHQLDGGPLVISGNIGILGAGARLTEIRGDGEFRTMEVPSAVEAWISGVTISDGVEPLGDGGNILNEGELLIVESRITGGLAATGAGIANLGGSLTIGYSLIENNTAITSGAGGGGGISNAGELADLLVSDSTISGNSATNGGGIFTGNSTGNNTDLHHVTMTQNTGGALYISGTSQSVGVFGSILHNNVTASNCPAGTPTDDGYNIDSGTGCQLTGTGSKPGVDPQISPGQQNLGGQTNVFGIGPASPAAGMVLTCGSVRDQRGFTRTTSPLDPCDAGAYEIGELTDPPPGGDPTPAPTPTPTAVPAAQTPTPTAPPTPVATPEPNRSVGAAPVSGKVLVRLPGTSTFVALDKAAVLKVGAEYDTRKGEVEISAVTKPGAPPEVAKFRDGIFKLTQAGGITTLTLTEKLAPCKKARASAAKPKTRKLWGDGKGKFRTKGAYAAATVRGTRWLTQDSCKGTLIDVRVGSVSVRDIPQSKTILLRAGKKYLAKPR